MMSGNYTTIDNQNVSGSVPAVSDPPGHVSVKFNDTTLQTFPPSGAQGKISGGAGPPRDADAEAVAGSATWLGKGLSCVCVQGREGDSRLSFDLTPAQWHWQEHCLLKLQNRLDVSYDSSIPGHQEALSALWKASFPEEELRDLISDQWK